MENSPVQFIPNQVQEPSSNKTLIIGIVVIVIIIIVVIAISLGLYFGLRKKDQKPSSEDSGGNGGSGGGDGGNQNNGGGGNQISPTDSNGLSYSASTDNFIRVGDSYFEGNNDLENKLSVNSVDECARICLTTYKNNCKSFDYESKNELCYISSSKVENLDKLKEEKGTTYFERITSGPYSSSDNFVRVPNAYLAGNNDIENGISKDTVEDCAQLCLTTYKDTCKSFDYEFPKKLCYISSKITSNFKKKDKPDIDKRELGEEIGTYYFQRIFSGPNSRPDNFIKVANAYLAGNNDIVSSIPAASVEDCARVCLNDYKDTCKSFDYEFARNLCSISSQVASSLDKKDDPNSDNRDLGGEVGTYYYQRIF